MDSRGVTVHQYFDAGEWIEERTCAPSQDKYIMYGFLALQAILLCLLLYYGYKSRVAWKKFREINFILFDAFLLVGMAMLVILVGGMDIAYNDFIVFVSICVYLLALLLLLTYFGRVVYENVMEVDDMTLDEEGHMSGSSDKNEAFERLLDKVAQLNQEDIELLYKAAKQHR